MEQRERIQDRRLDPGGGPKARTQRQKNSQLRGQEEQSERCEKQGNALSPQ